MKPKNSSFEISEIWFVTRVDFVLILLALKDDEHRGKLSSTLIGPNIMTELVYWISQDLKNYDLLIGLSVNIDIYSL